MLAAERQKWGKTVFPRAYSPPFLQNDALTEEVGRLSCKQVPYCIQQRKQHWILLALSCISNWKGLAYEQRHLHEGWYSSSPFIIGTSLFQQERQMWLHRSE